MFGSSIYSFKNKIAYSSWSGGSGGGSGTDDDPYDLGTITVSPGDGDGWPDDDHGDRPSNGSGNSSPPEPEPPVEIVGVNHVETAIISSSGASSINGPITLVIADEYIIEHGAKLEAEFNGNAELVSQLEALGWDNFSMNDYRYLVVHSIHPGEFAAVGIATQIPISHMQARELVEQGYSVAEAQMIVSGTTADEFVFTDATGNYAEADVINSGEVLVSSGLDVSDGIKIINSESDLLTSYATTYTDPDDQPDNLTLADLSEIATYAAANTHEGRVAYYESLVEKGYAYAGLALGVVEDDGLAGIVARDYATAVGQSVGVDLTDQQWDQISQALMEADFAAREQLVQSGATNQTLGWDIIQQYHNEVFTDFGLPPDAWTPNVILNHSGSPDEAWDNLVNAGGITTMWSYRGFMNDIDALAAAERIEHWDELYTDLNGTLVPNDATINNDTWMLENMPAAFQAKTLWSADLLGSTVHEWVVDGTIESADNFVDTAQNFISDTYENIAEWIF